ncbi:MAG: vitamin K epoxide reductase family protein [Chloroflexota bacterium]
MRAESLRDQLQRGDGADLQRRRAIICFSLLGMASMSAATLFQTGIINHLWDPPLKSFDADKVNSSYFAYRLGAPDGPLAVLDFAANLPLAAFGRLQRPPWIALLAAGKAATDMVGGSYYFSLMPRKEKAWCGYCIIATLAAAAVLALALPEASRAFKALRDSR